MVKGNIPNGLLVIGRGCVCETYNCFCFLVVIEMFVFLLISINFLYIKDITFLAIT